MHAVLCITRTLPLLLFLLPASCMLLVSALEISRLISSTHFSPCPAESNTMQYNSAVLPQLLARVQSSLQRSCCHVTHNQQLPTIRGPPHPFHSNLLPITHYNIPARWCCPFLFFFALLEFLSHITAAEIAEDDVKSHSNRFACGSAVVLSGRPLDCLFLS